MLLGKERKTQLMENLPYPLDVPFLGHSVQEISSFPPPLSSPLFPAASFPSVSLAFPASVSSSSRPVWLSFVLPGQGPEGLVL